MKGGLTDINLIFVAMLLFALVILVIGFTNFIPSITYGKCWGDIGIDLKKIQARFNDLEPGEAIKVRSNIGSCVESVLLMNKEDFLNDFNAIRSSMDEVIICDGEEYKTMLAAVLRREDSPECAKALISKDPQKLGECGRYLLGLDKATQCRSLIGTNSTIQNPVILNIPKTGQKYCFDLRRISENEYSINFDEIKEDSECPEEKTRRLIDII